MDQFEQSHVRLQRLQASEWLAHTPLRPSSRLLTSCQRVLATKADQCFIKTEAVKSTAIFFTAMAKDHTCLSSSGRNTNLNVTKMDVTNSENTTVSFGSRKDTVMYVKAQGSNTAYQPGQLLKEKDAIN